MATALYPGSFDPFHNGHLDFVERLAALYDAVVVAVLPNATKRSLLPPDARGDLISASVAHLPNVRVVDSGGLTVDAAAAHGADVIVRSFAKEFRNEMQMAAMNRSASPVPTQFLAAPRPSASVSSSRVRAMLAAGDLAGVAELVPAPVLEAFSSRWARSRPQNAT